MLTNQNFLITRPAHQSHALQRELEQAGAHCICLPVLTIHPIVIDQNLVSPQAPFQAIIFTSRNAVECANQAWKRYSNSAKIFAIGHATETALREQGVVDVTVPADASSEALLALPALQSIQNEKIAIFTGKNSRPLLKETLQQRGAYIAEIICYERECPMYAPDVIASIATKSFTAILIYSAESLKNLIAVFSQHRTWLVQQQLLVVTEKIKTQAISAGFSKIPWVATGVSDLAVFEAMKFHV